jgi:hypothetical protein
VRRADVAQLVEHQLPKLRVAGSIPVVRFKRALQARGFRRSEGRAPVLAAKEVLRNARRIEAVRRLADAGVAEVRVALERDERV